MRHKKIIFAVHERRLKLSYFRGQLCCLFIWKCWSLFCAKLPQNLYSFKHFSTSRVRSGQIEPKLLERVVNQPQYSLNLAHLRGKPYDMGVYGCQSGDHEVSDLSRYFLSRPQESSFSNVFVISSVGMNSSEGVRNLFPIVKYGRT